MASADDYGYANVGFAHGPNPGNPEVRTPTMDGLVKEGVILDRHCAQPRRSLPPTPRPVPTNPSERGRTVRAADVYKYCSPTRSALMSGRIPAHVNQNNLNNDIEAPSGVDLRFTMLPQKLKLAGYTTSFVGKWWASSCPGPAAAVSATRG